MLFASQEVRIGKNCARGPEYLYRCTRARGHNFSQHGPTLSFVKSAEICLRVRWTQKAILMAELIVSNILL